MNVIGVLFFIILAIAFGMVFAAVAVGISAAWFLNMPFDDGWSAAWDRPVLLFVFSMIGTFLFGGASASRR